ncbi:MAG: non-canonical purine NTP pyrophosphatase [Gemmatimonadaceae bacterium]
MRRDVLLATRSEGKLHELEPLFAAAGFRVRTLSQASIVESPNEELVEAFETFEENALAKARYFFALAGGMPVVADDSGLCVVALGDTPGVRSKRWSGRVDLSGVALDNANNAKLVDSLRGVDDRRARYVCAAAWCDGATEAVARGETSGRLLAAPRGSGGFGYDPYFWSDDLAATFAEVSREAKADVSHRGRAFRELLRQLEAGR